MFINDLMKISKIVFYALLIIIVLLYAITSDLSLRYMTHKLASSSKYITEQFKSQGMNKVDVEGKVNLGLMSFTVTAHDSK